MHHLLRLDSLFENTSVEPAPHTILMAALIYDKGSNRSTDLTPRLLEMHNTLGGHMNYGNLEDIEGEPQIDIVSFSGLSPRKITEHVLECFAKEDCPFSFVLFMTTFAPSRFHHFTKSQQTGLPTIFKMQLESVPYLLPHYGFSEEGYKEEVLKQREAHFKNQDLVYNRMPSYFKKTVEFDAHDTYVELFFDYAVKNGR